MLLKLIKPSLIITSNPRSKQLSPKSKHPQTKKKQRIPPPHPHIRSIRLALPYLSSPQQQQVPPPFREHHHHRRRHPQALSAGPRPWSATAAAAPGRPGETLNSLLLLLLPPAGDALQPGGIDSSAPETRPTPCRATRRRDLDPRATREQRQPAGRLCPGKVFVLRGPRTRARDGACRCVLPLFREGKRGERRSMARFA